MGRRTGINANDRSAYAAYLGGLQKAGDGDDPIH